MAALSNTSLQKLLSGLPGDKAILLKKTCEILSYNTPAQTELLLATLERENWNVDKTVDELLESTSCVFL